MVVASCRSTAGVGLADTVVRAITDCGDVASSTAHHLSQGVQAQQLMLVMAAQSQGSPVLLLHHHTHRSCP